MNKKELRRMTSSQYVYQLVRDKIITGEYEMDRKITEHAISQELGVSPTPVREAIKQLIADGYLESKPYKGTRVRQYSVDDIIEAYRVYLAIQPLLIEGIMSKEDDDGVDRMLALLEDALEPSSEEHLFIRVRPFYKSLRVFADSAIINRCLSSLSAIVNLESSMKLTSTMNTERHETLYREIHNAMSRKDLEEVKRLLSTIGAETINELNDMKKELYQ